MTQILVVGAGFCGAAFAILRARAGLSTTLVDPRPTGRGAAYDTHPAHLLNVPAGQMGMFPGEPAHFLEWARNHLPRATASDFLPRTLYGRYIEETLRPHVGREITLVPNTAVVAKPTNRGWEVSLGGGSSTLARNLVLATGNPPPRAPRVLSGLGDRVIGEPWRPAALDRLGPSDSVLVLGTGLTALDVLLTLREQGHRGRIRLLSRRGLVPRPHEEPPAQAGSSPSSGNHRGLRRLARAIREHVRAEQSRGRSWQAAVDSLRPLTATLWTSLDLRDRRRFLEHARPWWDVHRHRAPDLVLGHLRALESAGRLDVVAGSIVHAESRGSELLLSVRRRGGIEAHVERWDRVVLATGPDLDLSTTGTLYAGLIAAGHLVQDELKIGLLADADGRALSRDGRATPGMYVLGGARRAQVWEVTSVPELRVQVAALAHTVGEEELAASRRPR